MTEPTTKKIELVKRIYGWKRDLPSHHDNFLMVANPITVANFPKQKFLSGLPPIYDQGQLGSCTANALAGVFEFEQMKQGLSDFMPSRLFIYYNERKIEGTIGTDSGASLSDGIRVLTTLGVCKETTWPYDVTKLTLTPSSVAFVEGSNHQILASKRVPMSIDGFKTMINMGYPIAFGFTVFSYMESQQMSTTGILKMPGPSEQSIGGHAVVCVGYSDTMKSTDGKHIGYLKVRNSWGPNWGIEANGSKGYFWMPYTYINLCSDAWVITKNEATMVKLNKEMSEPVKAA